MKKSLRNAFNAWIVMSFLILSASCGGGSGKVLVKVGNESIRESDLETLARVNPRLKPRLENPQGRQKILENYVEQEILYLESVNRGLHKTPELKDKLALYKKILISQALMENELNRRTKEYYENHKDEFERIKVSHILIRTSAVDDTLNKKAKDKKDQKKPAAPKHSEAEALKMIEGLRNRLVKGEDFGKIAKELSEDEKTKGSEGDLGFLTIRDRRLERWGWLPLAEKAFAMKMGEISDPIKTKDGFHLIKATEEKTLQPLEEAEAGIKFRLQADMRTVLLEDLKKKYKVEYTEAPSQAPAAPETKPTTP